MKKGIYLLPNSLTLCGMFAGFYSIISALKGHYVQAAWAIFVASVFDGLDGWVARMTHSTTRFGIELDSLSDLVAFGVAPSLMAYRWSLQPFGRIGWVAAFLFVACGALRLARYNVQMGSTEKKWFTGMPIPGAAGVVASTVLFFSSMEFNPYKNYFILLMVIALAFLMVSTMKFHGLKEIDFRERKPFWILLIVVAGLAVTFIHPAIALFSFAMIYLSIGVIENLYLLARGKDKKEPQKKAGH